MGIGFPWSMLQKHHSPSSDAGQKFLSTLVRVTSLVKWNKAKDFPGIKRVTQYSATGKHWHATTAGSLEWVNCP